MTSSLNWQSVGPNPWCTVAARRELGTLFTLQDYVHTPVRQYFPYGLANLPQQPVVTIPISTLPLLEMLLTSPDPLPALLPLSKLQCFRAVSHQPNCPHALTCITLALLCSLHGGGNCRTLVISIVENFSKQQHYSPSVGFCFFV